MLHRRGSSGPPSAHVYICLSGNVLRAYKKLASRTTSRLLAAGDSLHHEMRFHTLLGDLREKKDRKCVWELYLYASCCCLAVVAGAPSSQMPKQKSSEMGDEIKIGPAPEISPRLPLLQFPTSW
ncbi:uncharacterized protein LOC8079838 isoform X3 [Sorghum bicolor]|uniref:uncharacterized protein LOC8079838 isoform X3 n=1 Tax=Sorghum bicolor TaxID=4558 RepID=UPI000B423FFA|nr:uncharacterized protein LOC8079838 isoform X3 [Sorghum bicolor]|eukprot:XP_021302295.1 uncharacterized protein LOC8079838 isoform X3 [Sorghum bicolor]